jgi:hypothetical protein
MTIEQAMVAEVLATSEITNIIGERFFPQFVPQNESYPAATYARVAPGTPIHMSGADAALDDPRFQISSWAETLAAARALADEIEALFRDFAGTMGGGSGVTVQRSFFEGRSELPPDFGRGEAKKPLYQVASDFRICYVPS